MASSTPLRTYLRRAGVLTAAAIVVNLLVFGLGNLVGASFVVPAGGSEIQITTAPVVAFTIVPLLLGLALAALPVARRAPRGVRALQVLGAALAVLSILSPVVAGTDAVSLVFIALLHLVPGAAYVAALQPWAVRPAEAGAPAAARRDAATQEA